MRCHGCRALLLILCLTPASLWAKGPTTRIVIAGPIPGSSVEITDTELLRDFVVWAGAGVMVNWQEQTHGFIADWPRGAVAERRGGLPQFEVSFYVKQANRPLESQEERLAYVVSYEPDVAEGGGYVYLPGEGEAHYALNSATILRGREGHWFHASAAWNQVAMKLIAKQGKATK